MEIMIFALASLFPARCFEWCAGARNSKSITKPPGNGPIFDFEFCRRLNNALHDQIELAVIDGFEPGFTMRAASAEGCPDLAVLAESPLAPEKYKIPDIIDENVKSSGPLMYPHLYRPVSNDNDAVPLEGYEAPQPADQIDNATKSPGSSETVSILEMRIQSPEELHNPVSSSPPNLASPSRGDELAEKWSLMRRGVNLDLS
ncbi:MAG: hypothetical protein M1818_001720 [Claussenomyces sp. TS43310]|nr:MAG: hypothetical protein M1818_001720 [Claussenomyces sp. TS43310]